VPVSNILVDKLIHEGILFPEHQKISILAMAGIWNGPFPSLHAVVRYVETPAGQELFDLCDTDK
jgi:hypothetical protein